ncbi:hypothetical protein [Saccharolobus solfataricus]|uniref:Uncharacterized protein n=2 Tax=Saccharolobus solfataricus TaxID=2287 RepID=A0A157T2H4_SACSO|nr:hypothetical protein [Saccharolobus solfataricus]SAI85449.1 uncharacterised protein [Saccharolobus solfataricus]
MLKNLRLKSFQPGKEYVSILEKFLDYDLVVYPLPKAINFLKALVFTCCYGKFYCKTVQLSVFSLINTYYIILYG